MLIRSRSGGPTQLISSDLAKTRASFICFFDQLRHFLAGDLFNDTQSQRHAYRRGGWPDSLGFRARNTFSVFGFHELGIRLRMVITMNHIWLCESIVSHQSFVGVRTRNPSSA
ncbi:PDZ domain-containing protein [Psidium guajava]|nr:PDZ domain-containing protein [Psidium guajava]